MSVDVQETLNDHVRRSTDRHKCIEFSFVICAKLIQLLMNDGQTV